MTYLEIYSRDDSYKAEHARIPWV